MRFKGFLTESSYRFVFNTSKGFSKYDDMENNNLFIEKSGARRWHKDNRLITCAYVYDNDRLIGWAALNYKVKAYKIYGKITAGIIGVFVHPDYRGKGIAKLSMDELKRRLPTIKQSPLLVAMEKEKKAYIRWTIILVHEKRISKLMKDVFNDLNLYDENQYEMDVL